MILHILASDVQSSFLPILKHILKLQNFMYMYDKIVPFSLGVGVVFPLKQIVISDKFTRKYKWSKEGNISIFFFRTVN